MKTRFFSLKEGLTILDIQYWLDTHCPNSPTPHLYEFSHYTRSWTHKALYTYSLERAPGVSLIRLRLPSRIQYMMIQDAEATHIHLVVINSDSSQYTPYVIVCTFYDKTNPDYPTKFIKALFKAYKSKRI